MSGELRCPDCGARLVLSQKPKTWQRPVGVVFLCEHYPRCRGLASAHPDGTPCGSPVDARTRSARRAAHAVFDPLWSTAQAMYPQSTPDSYRKLQRVARDRAYRWLAHHMGMPPDACHIGKMDAEQIRRMRKVIDTHQPTPESIRTWAKEEWFL